MSRIRAAVMPGPGLPLEVREFERPALEMHSALLQVTLSEVCGTDVHLHHGRLRGVPYPLIPGHVTAGVLSDIRGTLTDVHGERFREGDRVTFLDVHGTCGTCWYCTVAKASTRCPHRKVYGVTYGVDDGLSGGWAEAIYLKPGTRCLNLAGVEAERFLCGGCSLTTALHAIELARLRIGDTVLVLGSGPVGISLVICALLSGAHRVLCIGAPAERLATARLVGAAATLDVSAHTPAEALRWVEELTGRRGADITIEATGQPRAVVEAMRYTRDAGRVVIVGQYTDHGEIAFNPHLDLNKKHLEVLGCWGCDTSHVYRAVQLFSNGDHAAKWSLLPFKRYGLHECGDALLDVSNGTSYRALVDPTIGA